MKRALLSLADKRGLIPFARALIKAGYQLVASGGTAKELAANKIACLEISELTGFPEIMGGRVKTLHPLVHGAILARCDQDSEVMQEQGITPIDLVAVNLYPFAQILTKHPNDHQLLIENIDIGGPTLLRAAAKNHARVCAVVDPEDYPEVIQSLDDGGPDQALRERLAAKTFAYTSACDALIAGYLAGRPGRLNEQPGQLGLAAPFARSLRYGENTHQQGVLYSFDKASGWGGVTIRQGKELSYNNIGDADAAWRCLQDLDQAGLGPACVIVKHANPCGAALGKDALQAYQRAFAADKESAFGGILAFNQPCDAELAKTILANQFAEVIIAPDFPPASLQTFASKPNLRLISLPPAAPRGKLASVSGGLLWQSDDLVGWQQDFTRVTEGQYQPEQLDVMFAWLLVKHLKSNAIAVVKNGQSIGLGAGQTSRVKALRQALDQASDTGFITNNSLLASDAFFPFADSVEIAANYGVGWIIQPGGSIRDAQVIAAARQHGIGMIFTHQRHFYH